MYPESLHGIIKMAVNHRQKHHRQAESLNVKRDVCANDVSTNVLNRTVRAKVLNNINSAIFALLYQRTTFTIVLILLSICSPTHVLCAESVQANMSESENAVLKDDVKLLSPVYIPLTESPKTIASPDFDKVEVQIPKKPSSKKFKTGNTLWDGLLNECMVKPSVSCIQKNVYSYLDDSLGFNGDVNVTNGFVFRRNKLTDWKYSDVAKERSEANTVDGENFEDETEEARFSESPIEEVTDALYGKSMTFLMRHDLELQLPEMMFGGAKLKISPRSIEGDGALVRLDLLPRESEHGTGRILFKKIKKFVKNKLLLALLAIVVIIKLIKLKLFVFLPLLMGVHNAKKLFLKFVLFVFPALSHIFKLCSWYHNNYHTTKYHHHHHQISHLHHTIPHTPHAVYGPPHSSGHVDVHHSGLLPPSAHHQSSFQPDQDWALSGPGLGPEYIGGDIHRQSPGVFHPKLEDANLINSWGLGAASPTAQSSNIVASAPIYAKPISPYFEEQKYIRQAEINRKNQIPQGPPLTSYANTGKPSPQAEKEALIRAAQKQAERLSQAKAEENLRKQAAIQQQKVSQNSIFTTGPSAHESSPVYDPFYTPILQRVDQVFNSLSFYNEPCKERLVCSMYKNPAKYSPHSNLVSNELSREASELQTPSPGSNDASRFYKYMQAARDGQEKKDCLRLYPQCSVNTER